MDDIVARSGNAARQDMKPGQAKWFVGLRAEPSRGLAEGSLEGFLETGNRLWTRGRVIGPRVDTALDSRDGISWTR